MVLIFPDGIFWGDESKLSEAKLHDIRLSQKQTSLYNSRNEILRGLAQKAESLGYDDPRNCPETKKQFKEVTSRYNEQIRAIDKQHIKSDKQIMALIENGC